MAFLREDERLVLAAAAEVLLPTGDAGEPGATAGGVVDYIERILTAFEVDPPYIYCGGPWADRGGDSVNHYLKRQPLGRLEELAWRMRIEGSQGIPEREFNGPNRGWQQIYREGLAALGVGFATQPPHEQERLLEEQTELRELLFQHCCEGMYAAPEYGGNPGMVAWTAIGYAGDVMPRGWSDDEVSGANIVANVDELRRPETSSSAVRDDLLARVKPEAVS